jgi:hypothetical protein
MVDGFVFVPHPLLRGCWIRTDRSVLVVACRGCKAQLGEPCKGKGGYHSTVCRWRKREAQEKPVRLRYDGIVVDLRLLEEPNDSTRRDEKRGD